MPPSHPAATSAAFVAAVWLPLADAASVAIASAADVAGELASADPLSFGGGGTAAVALGAATQAGILEGSVTQVDVFNVLEAALIRGIAQGADPTQRQKRGPTKSKSKRKRR